MKIFVPSYKRAGDVLTRKVIPDSIIAIHEFEEKDYKKKEGGELLIIPDELRGNIAKVRNFILDNANDDKIVMLDDDVRAIGYYEDCTQNEMSYNQVLDFIDNGYVMCEELGCRLWGINLQSDPKFYREYNPFSLLGAVLGTFSCHFKPELRYDEKLFLNEDYDFFLKNIKKYRKVLRFLKYHYMANHLNKAGGCGSYRLKDTEIEQSKIMQKRWGSKVFRFDINRSTNGIVNVPLKGI
jgi:hypothetical protein